jgi:uncharacterized peroxidase-related enzyme
MEPIRTAVTDRAEDAMWIKTIPYEDADDELRAVYDRQARALGEPTKTTLLGSLYPRLAATRLDLYAASEQCPSNLTPHQRNLISFVTSSLNSVDYCASQATIKLRETGFDNGQIITLANHPDELNMPPADRELVRYATKLTRAPGSITEDDIERLRAQGFTDLDILDANSQCAHLNYINRVTRGLGITDPVDPEFPAYAAIPEAGLPEVQND